MTPATLGQTSSGEMDKWKYIIISLFIYLLSRFQVVDLDEIDKYDDPGEGEQPELTDIASRESLRQIVEETRL